MGEGVGKVLRRKRGTFGQINTGALESSFSLFSVPANSKPQLERVYSLLQLDLADVCVPRAQ